MSTKEMYYLANRCETIHEVNQMERIVQCSEQYDRMTPMQKSEFSRIMIDRFVELM